MEMEDDVPKKKMRVAFRVPRLITIILTTWKNQVLDLITFHLHFYGAERERKENFVLGYSIVCRVHYLSSK